MQWWIWFGWWIIFYFIRLFWIYHQKHETIVNNPHAQIYANVIKNRVVFKIKTGYELELLSPETVNLLESTKKDVDNDKDEEDLPKLKSVENVLVYCNLFNNKYQKAFKILFTFVPDGQLGQWITFAPRSLIILKTTNAEFEFIEVWFTDQHWNHLK